MRDLIRRLSRSALEPISASPDTWLVLGYHLRLARRWACPRVSSPPRPRSASASCSTVNPIDDHSVKCGARQGKLDHRLGKTSASPMLGSDLDICSKGHPMSPSIGTLTHPVSRLLPHTEVMLQPLRYGHPLHWVLLLGRVADPSASALA